MKLRFTPRARRHIDSIHDYVARRNPGAATRVVARIRQTAQTLGELPLIGHKGLLPNTREMNVAGLPYIVVYRIEQDERAVTILSVFHGAQDREHAED
jgi:toxin ParE1/3/4